MEIRDAGHLWGKDSFETETILREAEGDASVGVSSIGPAGEKLVKIACINSDLYRQAGRGGVGAVMGSKNLKAIVIAGNNAAALHDRKRVFGLNKENYQRALTSTVAQARMKYRHSAHAEHHACRWDPSDEELSVQHVGKGAGEDRFGGCVWESQSHKSCLSCFIHCSLVTEVAEGKHRAPR